MKPILQLCEDEAVNDIVTLVTDTGDMDDLAKHASLLHRDQPVQIGPSDVFLNGQRVPEPARFPTLAVFLGLAVACVALALVGVALMT
jgi:hypothetical protein